MNAMLARSVQTSHVSHVGQLGILEGTWGMGLGRMLDRQPWVSHQSIEFHYGVVAKERKKRSPEHTHERKLPLTEHLRSQDENQERLFQRNPSPSHEKLRQLQFLTPDTRNKT
jgi:hypothetical protein